MSQFHPADASNFARLCMTAMATKSTPAQIKKAAGDAGRAHLPPQNAGLYKDVVRLALECGITASDRLIVAQAAYAVAMDLLANTLAFAQRDNLIGATCNARRRLDPNATVEVANRVSGRLTRRLNGYVRDEDDDEPDPTPPAAYASRAIRAQIANALDDEDETRRALTGAAA